jgi:5-methylcytosine-specific restriction endonuclease McrA
MRYTDDQLAAIYERTDGKCHLCWKKLAWRNYATVGARGAWEVDHCVPRARGGTDHGNNLRPACTSCNRSKQDRPSRRARAARGRTRAPQSAARNAEIRLSNSLTLGSAAAGLGLAGGPLTTIMFGLFGAAIGYDLDPDPS